MSMLVTQDDLYAGALARFNKLNLSPHRHQVPRLVFKGNIVLGFPRTEHRCEYEQVVHLDPFLVVPIARMGSVDTHHGYYQSEEGFGAYWVPDALVTHFPWQAPRPDAGYRPATRLEMACAYVQNQHLGSLRTQDFHPNWPIIEVCTWSSQTVKLHRTAPGRFNFPGENHHRLWIRTSSVPLCSSTRDMVLVS